MGQTYPYKEVIVIDDGSTDRSIEVIRSYGEKIRWEAGGTAAVVRRGIAGRLAKGEFIQFLDADDLLLPQKIERQITFLRNHACEIVTCDHVETAQNVPEGKIINCDPRNRSTLRWIIESERLGISAPLHISQRLRASVGLTSTCQVRRSTTCIYG